jgi:hypothetical protein
MTSITNLSGGWYTRDSQMMPSTTFPTISNNGNALSQTLDSTSNTGNQFCASSNLNTPFSEYNSGRVRGRNESNFIYKK